MMSICHVENILLQLWVDKFHQELAKVKVGQYFPAGGNDQIMPNDKSVDDQVN